MLLAGIAVISLVIFAMTGNVLACSLFGYLLAVRPGCRTAVWLRRADPNRDRGRVCFWFHLAAAGWQAAAAGILTIAIFGPGAARLGFAPNIESLNRALIAVVGGVGLATTLGWVAVFLSLRKRVRAFVVPNGSRLCGEDFDRLVEAVSTRRRFNYGVFVVGCSTVVPLLVVGTAIAIVEARGNPQAPANVGVTLGLPIIMLSPLVTVPVCLLLVRRTLAVSPMSCWGDAMA